MDTEKLLQEWIRGWTEKDFSLLESLCAPDMVEHSPLGQSMKETSVKFWIRMAREWDQSFVLDEIVSQDNSAALRWTEAGRAIGPFRGKPGSGQAFRQTYMEFLRFVGGKVVVRWLVRDSHFYYTQLGW